ncbi:MAG: M20/M25/M40 family metallo-hydrolase [bacterium]
MKLQNTDGRSKRFPAVALLIPLLAFLGPTSFLTAKKKTSYDFRPARSAMLSITEHESKRHVTILASDRFKGRGTGTHGGWLAAKYIAAEFARYGLRAGGDQGKYYQRFQVIRPGLKKASLALIKTRESITFFLKSDFIPFSFTGESSLRAPIVFAGYGISAPEFHYDDYEDIDAKGKIVLVLRHEPQENDLQSIFNGRKLTRHALFEEKAMNAKRHGAVAMLLVTDPNNDHGSMEPRGFWPSLYPQRNLQKRWQLQNQNTIGGFPAFWISGKTAEMILRETGRSLQNLQDSIDRSLRPQTFTIPKLVAEVSVKLMQTKHRTQNVLGILEGSDPELRNEVIVIGAHYDHLGSRNGKIFNGADDNASGTAGMLEIAEAFSESPTKPKRSILFAAFSAEELGLLGSKFYVEHPSWSLKKTVAMINLDMIGRNAPNSVSVIGSNRSPELDEINIAANREIGLELLYNGERFFGRSDQANFARYRIPVIFYNTDDHRDYHRPSDTADKIDAHKLVKIARLAFLVGWEIANSKLPPSYNPLY